MEHDFMQSYFGFNSDILEFARHLVEDGNKKAARELNKVVCVFGSEINPQNIIRQIRKEFNVNYLTKAEKQAQHQAKINEEKRKEAIKRAQERRQYINKNYSNQEQVVRVSIGIEK